MDAKLTFHLLTQVTSADHKPLEDYPIADWVNMVAEGEIEHKKTTKLSRKLAKEGFFSKKN